MPQGASPPLTVTCGSFRFRKFPMWNGKNPFIFAMMLSIVCFAVSIGLVIAVLILCQTLLAVLRIDSHAEDSFDLRASIGTDTASLIPFQMLAAVLLTVC